ncbi:low molecular weight phosphotyrosine protein phosphatase [Ruegeria sp. TrichCH4B]|nr:low molecular weight phosphotyrosine protein phosphatase [Ruegeria sp. TrichCH4B]
MLCLNIETCWGDVSPMGNLLFICGKGRKRSPTAASIAAEHLGQPTDFAGLSADSDERVSRDHLLWADTIAVMEKSQLSRLKRHMGSHLKGKRIVCLDIPDTYEFMQPELVEIVRSRLKRIVH